VVVNPSMTAQAIHGPDHGNGAECARATAPAELVHVLRERTQALHRKAERTGIINEVLRGRATRYGYAMLLRNLLPAYQNLEHGLGRYQGKPGVGGAARAEVYRAAALRSDLVALYGNRWEDLLPLLPEGEQYATRVSAAAHGQGERLIAHAYTRYLGDLSGGQIMKRMLAGLLNLEPSELSFYDFPDIADLELFKHAYRHALNCAATEISDLDVVVNEAMTAFELNVAVSESVQRTGGAISQSDTPSV
jgi:heme oxygenase